MVGPTSGMTTHTHAEQEQVTEAPVPEASSAPAMPVAADAGARDRRGLGADGPLRALPPARARAGPARRRRAQRRPGDGCGRLDQPQVRRALDRDHPAHRRRPRGPRLHGGDRAGRRDLPADQRPARRRKGRPSDADRRLPRAGRPERPRPARAHRRRPRGHRHHDDHERRPLRRDARRPRPVGVRPERSARDQARRHRLPELADPARHAQDPAAHARPGGRGGGPGAGDPRRRERGPGAVRRSDRALAPALDPGAVGARRRRRA